MSRENEATVRRMLDALSARPEEAPAIVGEFWDADGDYYPVRKFPEARPCHGREAISRFLTDYVEAWSYRYTINDLIGVGDDRVLVCATLHVKGRGSAMKLEGDIYHCIWVRHGRALRQEDHLTLQGALHALGLEGDSLAAAGLHS
jgi:SnoaL-like protein